MKFFAFAAVCLSVLCLYNTNSAQEKTEKKQYVKITAGFTNIREELDPELPIIEQGKKGDIYELVFVGTSWYRVKVQDKLGWIDKRDGILVDNPNKFPIFSILLVILLLCGAAGAVYYYINKSKLANE